MDQFTDGSYPPYKRRNTGEEHMKKGTAYDNRDVVPYNAYLSKRFACPINAEVVPALKSEERYAKVVISMYAQIAGNGMARWIPSTSALQRHTRPALCVCE